MPANDPALAVPLLGRGTLDRHRGGRADSPRGGEPRPLWPAMDKWAFISLPGALGFKLEQGLADHRDKADLLGPGGVGDDEDGLSPRVFSSPSATRPTAAHPVSLLGPGTCQSGRRHDRGGGVLGIMRDIAGAALVLAIADYAFQRRQFNDSMRMTREAGPPGDA